MRAIKRPTREGSDVWASLAVSFLMPMHGGWEALDLLATVASAAEEMEAPAAPTSFTDVWLASGGTQEDLTWMQEQCRDPVLLGAYLEWAVQTQDDSVLHQGPVDRVSHLVWNERSQQFQLFVLGWEFGVEALNPELLKTFTYYDEAVGAACTVHCLGERSAGEVSAAVAQLENGSTRYIKMDEVLPISEEELRRRNFLSFLAIHNYCRSCRNIPSVPLADHVCLNEILPLATWRASKDYAVASWNRVVCTHFGDNLRPAIVRAVCEKGRPKFSLVPDDVKIPSHGALRDFAVRGAYVVLWSDIAVTGRVADQLECWLARQEEEQKVCVSTLRRLIGPSVEGEACEYCGTFKRLHLCDPRKNWYERGFYHGSYFANMKEVLKFEEAEYRDRLGSPNPWMLTCFICCQGNYRDGNEFRKHLRHSHMGQNEEVVEFPIV